jgi:4-amino-4-deoxy-L-arabinose transferase-like glycosyltransferase
MKTLSLWAILVAYIVIAAQYAALTPDWQIPDEPAHYNVIRQIAETGALPRLEQGDYDQAYLERLTAEGFPPELSLERVQYQDYQPPLYYLMATPVFLASGGDLTSLRLFSVVIGLGAIAAVYALARELAGPDSWLPLAAAGFAAFIPQHVAILAGVTNDGLAELWVTLGLWLMVRELKGQTAGWWLPLVVGAGLLTKVWAYVLVPAIVVMLLVRWRAGVPAGALARRAAEILLPALLLGSLYWLRNTQVCGPQDLVCGTWHNQIVVGQPRTAEWVARDGLETHVRFVAQTTFNSFWGQFGWMGVPLQAGEYYLLRIFSVVLVLGAALAWRLAWPALSAQQRLALALLTVSALTTVGLFVYYNLEFVQAQGRYLYTAVGPLSLLAAVGMWGWGEVVRRVVRGPWGWLVPVAVVGLMYGLCWYALYRVILPALT